MIFHCHYYSQTEHLFLLSDLREYYESQQLFSCNQTPSSSSNSQNLQSPTSNTHTYPPWTHTNNQKTWNKTQTRDKSNLNGAINGVSCGKPLIRLFAEPRHRNRQRSYLRLDPFLVDETLLHSSVHRLHEQIRRSRRVPDRLLPRSIRLFPELQRRPTVVLDQLEETRF